MSDDLDYHALVAILDWQSELGADEATGETPVDCFALADVPAPSLREWGKASGGVQEGVAPPSASPGAPAGAGARQALPRAGIAAKIDPADEAMKAAESAAGAATSFAALKTTVEAFEFCDLRRGARACVFGDGASKARVMVIGEAPDDMDERAGQPFSGKSGELFDKMFGAIGLSRTAEDFSSAVHAANLLPWRLPRGRAPEPAELAMMVPFLRKRVELVAPEVLVLMGNHVCEALIGRKGMTRLRGRWVTALERPALPIYHPTYLRNMPVAKREAWEDLLALKARLNS